MRALVLALCVAVLLALALPCGAMNAARGREGVLEFPAENPFARDKRVPMNHRVLESIPARVAALSEELEAAGYGARQVSQAELIQAVLHFYLPASADDARDLVQRWALLKAAPPAKRPE